MSESYNSWISHQLVAVRLKMEGIRPPAELISQVKWYEQLEELERALVKQRASALAASESGAALQRP
jgi:hypothetical protein